MSKDLTKWASIATIAATIIAIAAYFGFENINSFSMKDLILVFTIIVASILLFLYLKERQKRILDESKIRELKNKEYTSNSHGIIGSYSEIKVLSYLEKENINEIWLSGAALYNCVQNILSILNDRKLFFSEDTSIFKLKLIITDIKSENAKRISSNRLPIKDNGQHLQRTNDSLKVAYGNIVTLVERLQKRFDKVEYEIFIREEHLEERIWIMNPDNEECDGVYEGGFQFVLENDYKKDGYKFYHDKFMNYMRESKKITIIELKEITGNHDSR